MKEKLQNINHWYKNHQRQTTSLFLIWGFVFDLLTLQGVDSRWDITWLFFHLTVVSSAIFFLNKLQYDISRHGSTPKREKMHFWLLNAQQFSFGGLFGVFLILYFKSATLSVSWPFLLMLIGAFAANEALKEYHERIEFQMSFLYLSVFSFAVFFLPVVFKRIGWEMFLLAGLVSFVFIFAFGKLLKRFAHEPIAGKRKSVAISVLGIFAIFNLLYFTHLIPPLPLSLSDSGIYHQISRSADGTYRVTSEPRSFSDYFKRYPDMHIRAGESLYAYTAIFSPSGLNTSVLHEWQRFDDGEWKTTSTIPLALRGGRDNGYRTYSMKSNPIPGKWRVNARTSEGGVLGRLRFEVVQGSATVRLQNEVK